MDLKTEEEFWSLSSLLFLTFHQRIKHLDSLVKSSMLEPHFICRFGLQSNLISHLEKRTQTKFSYENITEGRYFRKKIAKLKSTKPLYTLIDIDRWRGELVSFDLFVKKFGNFMIWKLIENPQLKVWQGLDSVASIALQVFGRQTICSAFFQIRATKNFERENI